jgi:hypothetical protein
MKNWNICIFLLKIRFFDGKSRYPLKPRFLEPLNSIEAFTSMIVNLKKYNHFNNQEVLILFDIADKYIKKVNDNIVVKELILEQLVSYKNLDTKSYNKNLNSLLELVSTHFDNLPFDHTDFIYYDKFIDLWFIEIDYNKYCKIELRKFTSISFTHEIIGVEETSDYPYA